MAKKALLIAGSPADNSRSSRVLAEFGWQLNARGFSTESYAVRGFGLEDLVFGRAESETVRRFLLSVQEANALVFSTPTYKATYAGALKLIIDLIAPTALEGKALLAISTARLEPHLNQVDDSFQRLYRFFRGSIGLTSLGLTDEQLGSSESKPLELNSTARLALDQALERLIGATP